MNYRVGAASLLCVALSAGVSHASNLPAVKVSADNPVPACATPGRLLAYLKERNPKLDSRFDTIGSDYLRVGTRLGVRWDYAFFQMIVETGSLSFKRDGRSGDVKPEQNNFAGLGATGKGERGESFSDVATGVTAHLQHLLLYAGESVDDAVAERTRKVQQWGILTAWQKGIKGPITYTDLTRKWAPGAGSYGSDIEATGRRFYEDTCSKPDPRPELMAALTAKLPKPAAAAEATDTTEKVSGADLAKKAITDARAGGSKQRYALGAAEMAKASPVDVATAADVAKKSAPAFTILNATKPEASEKAETETTASVQKASVAGLAKPAAVAPPISATASKCQVLTASYGGQRAVIIRSKSEQAINYTVLEVNEATEKREIEAYIQAYAKGGEPVGEFGTQTLALDKAFDLCPEG